MRGIAGGLELSLAAYRLNQARLAIARGEPGEAAGYIGEAFLRLIGAYVNIKGAVSGPRTTGAGAQKAAEETAAKAAAKEAACPFREPGVPDYVGTGPDSIPNPVQQQQARPRTWATQSNAYWDYGKRFFPTRANSGLASDALRLEQKEFFKRGLLAGKDAAELRGQAAAAGYTRYGGWMRPTDRLADVGAERALQEAIQEVTGK